MFLFLSVHAIIDDFVAMKRQGKLTNDSPRKEVDYSQWEKGFQEEKKRAYNEFKNQVNHWLNRSLHSIKIKLNILISIYSSLEVHLSQLLLSLWIDIFPIIFM